MTTEYSGFRASEIHAWFVIDGDDEEGIPAFQSGDMAMPLVATDRVRIEEMNRVALRMSRQLGTRIEHVKFTTREHVEWLDQDPHPIAGEWQ